MNSRTEPWYVHAALYAVIVILAYILIRVAIIEPKEVVESERYFKTESRLRMSDLRAAEKLWQEKNGQFTDNLNNLINFVKYDSLVQKTMTGVDTITGKSTNPFLSLSVGEFIPDSLYRAPKSHQLYLLQVDTTVSIDTVIDRRGRIKGIDTTIVIGNRYRIECPDGYGTIGDLYSDALKNAASWE